MLKKYVIYLYMETSTILIVIGGIVCICCLISIFVGAWSYFKSGKYNDQPNSEVISKPTTTEPVPSPTPAPVPVQTPAPASVPVQSPTPSPAQIEKPPTSPVPVQTPVAPVIPIVNKCPEGIVKPCKSTELPIGAELGHFLCDSNLGYAPVCTVTQCKAGYKLDKGQCIDDKCPLGPTKPCGETDLPLGALSGIFNCDTATGYSTSCTIKQCKQGYELIGTKCVENKCPEGLKKSCPLNKLTENALSGYYKCNPDSGYSEVCSITACIDPYVLSDNKCIKPELVTDEYPLVLYTEPNYKGEYIRIKPSTWIKFGYFKGDQSPFVWKYQSLQCKADKFPSLKFTSCCSGGNLNAGETTSVNIPNLHTFFIDNPELGGYKEDPPRSGKYSGIWYKAGNNFYNYWNNVFSVAIGPPWPTSRPSQSWD